VEDEVDVVAEENLAVEETAVERKELTSSKMTMTTKVTSPFLPVQRRNFSSNTSHAR